MNDVNGVSGSSLAEVFAEAEVEVPRRRGRWILPLLLVLVLLVAAGAVAEWIGRMLVSKAVEAAMTRAGVETDGPVTVEIDGVLLLQLATGSIATMRVDAQDASVRGIDADVAVTLHDVGLVSREAKSIEMVADVDAESIGSLVETAGASAVWESIGGAPEISFDPPLITLTSETSVAGIPFSVVIGALPSADDGDLVLAIDEAAVEPADPDAIELPPGVSLDDLTSAGLPGAPAIPKDPIRLCLAGTLPNGARMTDASVSDDSLEMVFDIDGRILTQPSLRAAGSCS